MNLSTMSASVLNCQILKFIQPHKMGFLKSPLISGKSCKFCVFASSNELDKQIVENPKEEIQEKTNGENSTGPSAVLDNKDLKKAVLKTASTFAPRASTATKNPAKPGTVLYTVFEVQAYASLLLGGALSFNLIFPSNEPDIWRLMGMWSIWMFTIPSLRARDCSKNEKEALNYLFLLVPLINVIIPFFLKSFAVVWSADTVAFLGMYAWKLGWLQKEQ
ncbi:protein RESISTANCE TO PHYTOPHTHORA 1, chloroplastic [Lycium ferocissimum]|uniref:protein RESISTANCE TO PHYTOPHTHORA 1, chloroplastic n=1 Tax=Lycium ferocissimum TaxID=112874 RepID=UPI0028169054|nr:protein RESISTANCE TO PHYTOPHTHORA 1, chloroplastic [Lycium ferocissimum]